MFFSIFNSTIWSQDVITEYGIVKGEKKDNVFKFLGIPFAKPPIGNLRWKPTQAPQTWTGVKAANQFAPVCPQKMIRSNNTEVVGSEDCLYLNIWSPQIGAAKKAVMVFIHGGGNQVGGASTEQGGTQFYDGTNIASRGDVVVVTIQYRLGALGFLVHPGLDALSSTGTSGNYAVLDQIQALKWIKSNIAAFGGDPDRIMVYGESAGGVNTGNLLITDAAKGLFNRATIQSAVPVLSPYTIAKSEGISFVNHFKSQGTDKEKIEYLYTLPADSMVSQDTDPVAGGVEQQGWSPVLDNYLFNQQPKEKFQSGTYNKMPIMIGTNADEMSLNAPQTVTPAQMNLLINTLPVGNRNRAAQLYPPGPTNDEAKASYIAFLTDAQFTSTVRRIAQCASLSQSQPVYRYLFSHIHTINALKPFGSYHGMELFYVFNTWENATLGKGIFFKDEDDKVQQYMLAYWTNFAKTGNPNSGSNPTWLPYTAIADNYLDIKASPVMKEKLRLEKCEFWNEVINFTPCMTVGTEDDVLDDVTVYPNPVTDDLIISNDEPFNFSLTNLDGILLISNQNAQAYTKLSMADLPTGLYIVSIESSGKKTNKVIVKI
jgi:para-nitrobenzyl esterase